MRISRKLIVVSEFIPLVLALAFYLNSFQFILFTHTVLGKFLLLALVLFYTYIDHIVGLFFCVLYIFYYQTDFSKIMNDMYLRDRQTFTEGYSDLTGAESDTDDEEDPPAAAPGQTQKGRVANFVAKHCLRGRLMNPAGGGEVSTEMIEHVFPELGFSKVDGGKKCNPCDKTCNFSIREKKLKTEQIMITPKQSNAWYDTLIGFAGGSNGYSDPITVPGVISESFSFFRT